MKVKITRMDHQGRGISTWNNKIMFIPNTLPDEEVETYIVKENKKYIEAKVQKYLSTSINRIESTCPYYQVCGGCHLRHVKYEDELKYKENKIHDIINKFTSYNTKIIKPIICNDESNYRNKITFHVDGEIGLYNIKSNEIVKIDNCLLADHKINDALTKLKQLNLDNIYEIVVRASKTLKDTMIVLKLKKDGYLKDLVKELKPFFNTIITYYNKQYKTIYGNGYIYDQIGDYTFKISPDSFFQVNTLGAEKLYNKVLEYLKPTKDDVVLDLYCGTGTIGIYISKHVKKVLGIEINKYAIEDALENKKTNKIDNIEFKCLDASDISIIRNEFNKIIIDPPRSGLDKKTIEYIKKSEASEIVYVSCDPITFARDVEILKDKYELLEITPVDMFPRTYHVECVALLKIKTQ